MPDSQGDNAQVRKIADQLYDAWADRQDKPRANLWSVLPAWIACILSIGTMLWQVAVTTQRVNDNNRRIIQLESDVREQASKSNVINERLARIEAKLDLMVKR